MDMTALVLAAFFGCQNGTGAQHEAATPSHMFDGQFVRITGGSCENQYQLAIELSKTKRVTDYWFVNGPEGPTMNLWIVPE